MKWTGAAQWMKKEVKAGDRLPFDRHIDPSTIRLRDGAVMRTLHIGGMEFETQESDQLDHAQTVREVLLRSVLDARFVLYHHVVRRRVTVASGGEFESPFCTAIGRKWDERLAERQLFVNEQFLTIVRRPARGKTGLPERLQRKFGRKTDDEPGAIRELDAATASLLAGLEPYGARLLSCYREESGTYSEPLEFLSSIYNGEMRPVVLPAAETDLGHHLPYRRVSFGLDAIELAGAGNRSFGAMLSIKEYPGETRPGLIDDILRLPCELVLTETFAPADRQIARERIDLALRRQKASEEDSGTERREMLTARDALGAGQTGFGDHHFSLLVRGPDLPSLDKAMATAAAAVADIGAIAVREDVNLEPLFWGQFPGNESYLVRRALISSTNAAGFISLHGFPVGKPTGNHWGDAVTVLETTSSTPYFFNFHEGDLGHFSIIGPSGSGKTVVLNFLAAQAQKFGPRTIFFDKDRGAELFLRAAGGHYSVLRPGEATGFNPLSMPNTPENKAFIRDWLGILLTAEGPEELAAIASAVDACFDHDPSFRRLRYFQELLGGRRRPEAGDLAARLEPWIHEGEHAWMFDNEDDKLDLSSRILGFDMTALLDSPRLRTPAMMYLFHRIDERLDGEPTQVLIDEGWKALDDPVFAARIRDWLKTLRKRNAIVGFATQSARDALDSQISAALVEQTATMIFMPNAKAKAEDYCAGFGLSAHELELIRSLPAHSRCFLIRHANHSVVVRLDLSGMPELLMILSGREASVRRLDAIRQSVGDNPVHWYPLLTRAGWPGGDSDGDVMYLEAAE
ncbi:VirB4 family type IV secretion/conjugal transfer ATPase [Sphingomonas sp. SM33]|uniref:Type IV secretion system protein virB4 n=1 Tax=Sphingomonas telluris TaxID=2907998 RepID=A0ABS9VR07_9SPHN|nr:VirB4 family type IV secretion/conjugal transfer ATPase [Sphingomonas telluris]MCH8617397.1 VirB4 family type IV secretion/conjugal transfer ATPase [Sphingomonas telluris]